MVTSGNCDEIAQVGTAIEQFLCRDALAAQSRVDSAFTGIYILGGITAGAFFIVLVFLIVLCVRYTRLTGGNKKRDELNERILGYNYNGGQSQWNPSPNGNAASSAVVSRPNDDRLINYGGGLPRYPPTLKTPNRNGHKVGFF